MPILAFISKFYAQITPIKRGYTLPRKYLNYLLVLQNNPKYHFTLPLNCLIINLTGHYIDGPEKNRPKAYSKELCEGGK